MLSRLEVGRQLYNACLGESVKRLNLYKQSKLYQFAKTLPKGKERTKAFATARESVGYTEYAMHSYAAEIRNGGGGWIAKHIDANTAQKLATRAFQATERVKKGAKRWTNSKTYLKTRQRKAEIERQLAAHRKSLQNQLAHEVFSLGNVVKLEKLSYKAFQRMYGKSVGRRAPSMFVERLRRIAETAASATVFEFPTRETKLSQRCLCGRSHKKSLSQRVHRCKCGIVAQRDLFSGFLGQFVDLETACFNATLANHAWSQGWDTILMTAWQQATTLYNQSSIGKPMACQRSGNAASEKIVSKALEVRFKTQDAVASCESLGEKPIL